MKGFTFHFRERAIPRLREIVEHQARLVALEMQDWVDAYDEIISEACKLGASHLPPPSWREFKDWVSISLLEAISDAKENIEKTENVLVSKAETDPVAYYSALAASCSQHESISWVFAAISPEYRRSLLAERCGGK